MKLDVLALQAAMVSHDRLGESAIAFASELATRLGCERVSVGFVEDRFSRVVALSHGTIGTSATNGTEMLRVIGAAMDESIEQGATVVLPAPPRAMCRRSCWSTKNFCAATGGWCTRCRWW